jgi:F-type H+-transporting ATPase subunit gamma
MASLRDIKKRIHNVSMVEKTTQSMKVISTSRLNWAKTLRKDNKDYIDTSYEVVSSLLSLHKEKGSFASNKYLSSLLFGSGNNIDNKHIIICVTSDRGLCGSYNSNVLKQVNKKIEEFGGIDSVLVLPIGTKASIFCSKLPKNSVINLNVSSDLKKTKSDQINILVDAMVALIKKQEVSSIDFIYTKNISILEQQVSIASVLPMNTGFFQAKNALEEKTVFTDDKNFEDTIYAILENYFIAVFYDKISDASLAEHSARLTAMDNAYNNCKDLKASLTLSYNRTRQGIITKELIEIISGAESI